MTETRPKPANRITCTKCGVQLVGATIQQMLEWDKTHVCAAPDEEPK
jgi:hypothetical protein